MIVLVALALSACGESSKGAANGLPTTQTEATDPEHLLIAPMGTGKECERRLTEIVDVEYLAEHDVTVPDDDETRTAIADGVVEICKEGPPEETVHEGSHRVVHFVEHQYG
jgi:hypothetical protein